LDNSTKENHKKSTVVAQNASHGSKADVSLKLYLEAVNEENHRTSEEMRMIER
jgi:hypothetical protein